jgi:serine phosphatase RsbU (regulator of sigma subunit)
LLFIFLNACQNQNQKISNTIAKKGTLNLEKWSPSQSINLEGEWAFYPQQFLKPDDSTTWKKYNKYYLEVPAIWGNQKINGKYLEDWNFGTYHLRIHLPQHLPTLALKLLSLGTAYEIYINGKFIAKNGSVGKDRNSSIPYMLPQVVTFTNYTETIDILVYISNFHYRDGGFWNSIKFGEANTIQAERDRLVAVDLILAGCFIIMAIYHVGMFLLRRKDLAAFYFSWVNIFFAFRILLTDEKYFLHLFPSLPWELTFRAENITIYGALLFYVLFFRSMYKQEFSKLVRNILVISSLFLILLLIFTPTYIFSEFLIIGNIILILAIFYGLYILLNASNHQKSGASVLFAGLLVLFLTFTNEFLVDYKILSTNIFSSYGLLLFVFLQSFGLSVRYAQAFTQVEDLTKTLERKVEVRTFDLEEKAKIIEKKNQDLEKQKLIIEKKNETMQASVNYASRIQQAILGNPDAIASNFKESFIILQPRDTVSGDFYWFTEVKRTGTNAQGEENKTLFFKVIAAGDCTGHGIPGAFMTVLANALLDEIVNENKITQPAKILSLLDRKLLMKLQKQGVNDGMDISLLIFDEENKKVTFSGANNPLYYVRNGELIQVEASKCPIGGDALKYKDKKKFENTTIDYQKGDIFYLFSDGYQDQFGGPDNLKYYKKNFRNFLLNISHLPLKQQREELLNEFNRWKGNYAQTDDILVIGIKV